MAYTLPFLGAADELPLLRTAEGELTRRQMARHAARFARALRAHGAEAGDRIAVQVDKSWQAAALYLGVLQAGLIYVPFNTAYTRRELSLMLEDAQPRVLICDPSRRDELAQLAPVVLTLDGGGQGSLADAAAQASDEPLQAAYGPDDAAAIVFTSGTTGRAKGATLSHANLQFSAAALVDAWRIRASDVLLHTLPLFHVHGLFIALNTMLSAGARLHLLSKFDEDALFAALPDCNLLMGVPTHYTRLLADARLDRAACAHMRLFVSGSAPLLTDTFDAFAARTGHTLLERYGMTETSVIASNPYDGPRLAGTVGMALPGTELRVVDEAGAPTAEVGSVQVRGPHVFQGYYARPEQTRQEHTADGFFVTGDLGQLDEHGRLTLVGRRKDLIITGGLNVVPKEVELLLDAAPGVLESAVVGLPHADFGEAVTAFVVLEPGATVSLDELSAQLRPQLAPFKRPKRLLVLDELPRNTMGKVQKTELRARYATLYSGAPSSS